MNDNNFEVLGGIIKEEKLYSVKEKVLENTLVLESKEPYPGYHHALPTEPVPRSVFLITKNLYTREDISRTSQKIKQYCTFNFESATGEIYIHNNLYPCIRIKNLDKYEQIAELQSFFLNEGIVFKKSNNISHKAIIKVKKAFLLSENEDHIFCDKLEDYQGYFSIPKQLSWKLFEKITYSIKNNWQGQHFDAALGYIYKDFEILDMVRIYHRSNNIEILTQLKDLYLKEMAKY
jgi:hypothetical protein